MQSRNYLHIICLVLVTIVALAACRAEERPQPSPSPEIETPKGDPVLFGAMEFQLDMPQAMIVASHRSEAEPEDYARAKAINLEAPNQGNYPHLSFDDVPEAGEDLWVFVVLRNKDGSKAYYSEKPVKWRLRKTKDKSRSGGTGAVVSVQSWASSFVKIAGSAPRLTAHILEAEEAWYMEAIYIPGLADPSTADYAEGVWDSPNKHLNVSAVLPKKFYQGGQKLSLGKDINIPFVLKSRSGTESEIFGVPLRKSKTEKRLLDSLKKADPSLIPQIDMGLSSDLYTLGIDPKKTKATFRPVGSLYCLKFQNSMGASVDTRFYDESYWRNTNGTPPEGYNYRIQGAGVSSEIAAVDGYFDYSQVSALGDAPRWGHDERTSYDAGVQFADADAVDLDRGASTGWYYLWMHNLPEPKVGGSTTFYLDLYNKSLDEDMQSFRAFSTHQTTAGQAFQDGKSYYRTITLNEELRPLPLMLMGRDFIVGPAGNVRWADSAAVNNARSWYEKGVEQRDNVLTAEQRMLFSGTLYLNQVVQEAFSGTFSVHPSNEARSLRSGIREVDALGLQWQLPDIEMVYSVFPKPQMTGINLDDIYHWGWFGKADETKETEAAEAVDYGTDIRIEGVLYKGMKSLYYRKANSGDMGPLKVTTRDTRTTGKLEDRYVKSPQTYRESVNVFYALRFVGTPYASAYRYIQWGKWLNRQHRSQDPWGQDQPWHFDGSDSARYIINAKRISSKVGMRRSGDKYVYSQEDAMNYLKNTIATADFWVDPVVGKRPSDPTDANVRERELHYLHPNVVRRVLHPLGKVEAKDSKWQFVGRSLCFWIKPFNQSRPPFFLLTGYSNSGGYGPQGFTNTPYPFRLKYRIPILPFLAPYHPR